MDGAIRRLERAWRASGTWEDEEAFVLARARESGCPLLRGDGLYQARLEESASAEAAIPVYDLWLRFLGGRVAAVTTVPAEGALTTLPAEAALVGQWLAVDHPGCTSGHVTQEGARFTFELASPPSDEAYSIGYYRARMRASGSLEVEPVVLPYEKSGSLTYAFQPLPTATGSEAR